jgi:predicted phosphodiesterase
LKLAIFSDVHGNLEALNAVLKAIDREEPDRHIFLGDVVGYGANPNECCELIFDVADIMVLGNHDAACIDKLPLKWFNAVARSALMWTIDKLDEKYLRLFLKIPYKRKMGELLFSHALPRRPESFDYDDNLFSVMSSFEKVPSRVLACLYGHSHRPIAFAKGRDRASDLKVMPPSDMLLDQQLLYLFNVGSVGQPRDGDPRASYAVYDTEKRFFTVKRVEYEVKKAADKIMKAGLPQVLCDRLFRGM